ncbi:MAG: InlB B-repeat-containing protein [Panacagrimonas sp.]
MTFTRKLIALATLAALGSSVPAHASTAYGDLNNFDVINDTGEQTHGFEIELEDVHSTGITYTYDYNHYGAPTITEDNTNPAHPRVRIRYKADFNPATGAWSSYTAVPGAPLPPTQGHQCTNPSVNLGCEHFGVGYYGAPTRVIYHWLVADPANPGGLIRGPAVNIATPSFVYYPPVAGVQPVAQVQAVIRAPEPVEVPVKEFGEAQWVKQIRTETHNNARVELRDLVSDDPNDPNDKNWENGEPAEVETEWQLLQTEFSNPEGANNDLAGANEDLPGGDEVVTRRYEFFKYTGPLDPESGEANCDNYPQVADAADPKYKADCDPAVTEVLGDYIGAQMAGFNVEAPLGLIDHLQDGELDQPYTERTVVVGGNTPYAANLSAGSLPDGLSLNPVTGVLSGTPTVVGSFTFTVHATDADAVEVSKAYTLVVPDTGVVGPVQFEVSVSKAGAGTGTVSGNGIACGLDCAELLDEGTLISLTATPDAGKHFDGWSGPCVGTASCQFALTADTVATATFSNIAAQFPLAVKKTGGGVGTVTGAGINCGASCTVQVNSGSAVTLNAAPALGSVFIGWTGACTGSGPCNLTVNASTTVTAVFRKQLFRLLVSTQGNGTGTVSGGGIDCGTTCVASLPAGTPVSLTPTPSAGSKFVGWRGACTGTGGCAVTMSAAKRVTAIFAPLSYRLDVQVSGPAASGRINTAPAGIRCGTLGTDCTEAYAPGKTVTLSPFAASRHHFLGWSGDCSGTGACVVQMGQDRRVVGSFD